MESSTDSYLHKKFKKQLSQYEAPKKIVDPEEEERRWRLRECNTLTENQSHHPQQKDNNSSVPNQSTNQNSPHALNVISKSSISVVETSLANVQSANSCISYVVSSGRNPEPVSAKSSILDVEPEPGEKKFDERATGGKYVCSYCNLVCSKPSVLQKHIRAHTNERPYPCKSCGFSFKTRSNLYKHCRSRTHANRVMGNHKQEGNNESELAANEQNNEIEERTSSDPKSKPYKPRFHTKQCDLAVTKENIEEKEDHKQNLLSEHINDIISKNHSIVNASDAYALKKKASEVFHLENNNEEAKRLRPDLFYANADEPLNLTKNNNRKRCMSEVMEPVVQKSLIKELLLKNLNSDMQCLHCKMIFQTVTELELHKLRSCKGFVKPGAKYSRSNSVNVASILTQNKNAFDNIPNLQNAAFPLKSPGPFLGKTRLVESDKNKSFSFDDGLQGPFPASTRHDRYLLSPLSLHEKERKAPIKMFGGEVKITHSTGETKSFKVDAKESSDGNYVEFGEKVSENRLVKSGLQSGGTVLTNKTKYSKSDASPEVIRGYEHNSPSIDLVKNKFNFDHQSSPEHSPINFQSATNAYKYPNIVDFSQKAVKLLAPNLKQLNLAIPGLSIPAKPLEGPQKVFSPAPQNMYNPMNLLVDGKVVRYVPGIPGPIVAEQPIAVSTSPRKPSPLARQETPTKTPSKLECLEIKTDFSPKMLEMPSPIIKVTEALYTETKKFSRPNSLALKPTTASLKQHHGLTPTMFNQILISPDTPRGAKKYVQQFLHGNYFSYLGLKCSTKPVYCTLNKTQPFYVPHFKKLSMYSEWRQQDTKTDKFYVSGYDSRQSSRLYTAASKSTTDLVVHSSYKFIASEFATSDEKNDDQQKGTSILGGYECNDDYTYIRGRGRGRYVCDQCGIRCKKPSMLKKHIRTHSNDRPYTCSHCNFSFKTKGNLTKHMKSKAHTKNYAASGSSSSTQLSGTQSSDSDTDDSGMDSSDESTRREEHEAAYGLLSLSQKNVGPSDANIMNPEEIAHVSKSIYAKNKTMEERASLSFTPKHFSDAEEGDVEESKESQFLGKTATSRPLTYPYTSVLTEAPVSPQKEEEPAPKCIKQFSVIQKYAKEGVINLNNKERTKVLKENHVNSTPPPVLKVNDAVVLEDNHISDLRKRKLSDSEYGAVKMSKNDEVIDLSIEKVVPPPEVKPKNGHVLVRTDVNVMQDQGCESPKWYRSVEYDNSAMETLADIATKQVKLEKNTLAKSVASEYLKIATKNEYQERDSFAPSGKEVNDLIVKPEGSKSCHICSKSFSKMSQLRLHMNIHYLERPFRCHSCSVSFRSKGHLQKHERSASHHNKLSSSPALSSSEPRPFKCVDCSIAFRIHGHLAKHLRSKMHIMKLECLAKIPFGLYAELERSNSLLTEINTADGDQCLESLKTLAKKVFINDPNKLNQLKPAMECLDADS